MKEVTSTEFQQNVGRYQDATQLAPDAITKNGRTHSVLISAAFFEVVMKGRVARQVEHLDDATLKAISKSEVPEEYQALNDLIKVGSRESANTTSRSGHLLFVSLGNRTQ